MKELIMEVFVAIGLLTNYNSYPQPMLINYINIEDNQQVTIVDKLYKRSENYLNLDITVPEINGLNDFEKENIINKKIESDTERRIDEVTSIAEEYYKNAPKPSMPYQLFAKYTVSNLENIVSFYIDYYQFTGGAHGITERVAYNIDANTSEEIILKDLFIENYNYKEIINKEIEKQIAKNPDFYFTGKDGFQGIKDNQQFYIEDSELVIYFPVYEIAPYVTGISKFKIPNKLFNKSNIYLRVI